MQFLQPPILYGSETAQLMQLRQYLYGLSRDLNLALSEVEQTAAAAASAAGVKIGKSGNSQQTEAEKQLSSLKSLIIKTADTVHAEIETLETKLQSTYVAQSDFGTFSEKIETQLTATAEQTKQTIDYQAVLTDDLQGLGDAFAAYKTETGGYIKQGIVGYEDGIPVIGIAIGQDIKVTGTAAKDEKEYEIIDTSSNMSVWTPNKLSFFVFGAEAAYVSNGAFHAPNMHVLSRLYLGQNQWQISADRGLTVKWIGG